MALVFGVRCRADVILRSGEDVVGEVRRSKALSEGCARSGIQHLYTGDKDLSLQHMSIEGVRTLSLTFAESGT